MTVKHPGGGYKLKDKEIPHSPAPRESENQAPESAFSSRRGDQAETLQTAPEGAWEGAERAHQVWEGARRAMLEAAQTQLGVGPARRNHTQALQEAYEMWEGAHRAGQESGQVWEEAEQGAQEFRQAIQKAEQAEQGLDQADQELIRGQERAQQEDDAESWQEVEQLWYRFEDAEKEADGAWEEAVRAWRNLNQTRQKAGPLDSSTHNPRPAGKS